MCNAAAGPAEREAEQILMYHVTNVSADENRPDWREVKVHVADDEYFDGDLYDLPVACFTTTLRNGLLPATSPYPRQSSNGEKLKSEYWRVDVPFDPSDFDIYKMAEVNIQIHLLCLHKASQDEKEKVLAKIMPRQKLASQEDLKKYFPDDGANDYDKKDEHFFVNVCFINPVSLANGEWSQVKRDTKNSRIRGNKEFTQKSHSEKLREWGKRQLHLPQSSDRVHLQQIEHFMQNGSQNGMEALQKQWEGLFDQKAEPIDENDDEVNDELAEDFAAHKIS